MLAEAALVGMHGGDGIDPRQVLAGDVDVAPHFLQCGGQIFRVEAQLHRLPGGRRSLAGQGKIQRVTPSGNQVVDDQRRGQQDDQVDQQRLE